MKSSHECISSATCKGHSVAAEASAVMRATGNEGQKVFAAMDKANCDMRPLG